jgi:DNA-binding NarL/FixJ family response regulator
MAILFHTADLIFASRVQAAARAAERELIVAASRTAVGDALAEADVQLVLLDLTVPDCDAAELVSAVRESVPAARVVAYAPHVMKARLSAARDAGCDLVLTRGQFDRQLTDLVQS